MELTQIEADLGYLALGTVFLAIGLITLLLIALRSASRDATILLFGAMSCVWGARFLLYTQLVPLMLTGDPQALQGLGRALSYFSGAAAFGFAWAYLGPGWRGSLRFFAWLGLGFSMMASLVMMINPSPDLLLPVFNVMVLAEVVTVVANLLRPHPAHQKELRALIIGFGGSLVFFFLENLRALHLIPLSFDVEWIGVLILYLTLGRLIAIRMFTNERRLAAIRQELATARRIQSSLLPEQPPLMAGLDMAARYLPMNEVAGDFYDFYQVDEYRQTILVADVSGHGVPAALIASMVKGAFRAQVENIARPELVLSGMNQILTGQLNREYVTAICIFIDLEAGILRYAGAGHPPLLIRRKDGRGWVSLLKNGLLLGQFSVAVYRSVEQPLMVGDRLLLYTDGVLEATNAKDEDFGEDGLKTFLAGHDELSAGDLADALLAAVDGWTSPAQDESQDDDLTVVVVDIQ